MKIELFNSRFIKQDIPDDKSKLTGEWIAQSKYEFDLFANRYDRSISIFYVVGILDVDFAGGGSADFHCLLSYRLTEINVKPDIEILIEVAHTNAPLDFTELFVMSDLINLPYPDFDLWVPYEHELLLDLIKTSIEKHYPL
jgi:hypothetical protein